MPLPINTTLSLFGASRPGDALPSKPKKAMLFRMSSDILDALESSTQPQVQFQFGENPGLYIGDTCFPMIHSQETAMHELYLRAASATKKNAPLKLYASVVGKFTVDQREIGNELRDKIRESTQDAAAQRNSRATVFIDTPPETQLASKKRKEKPIFHKPIRQSDKVKAVPSASASSTPASKATPTHPSSTSPQGGVPVRKRLVHCLARGEKLEEELFKLLGADRNVSLRAEVSGLLDQLTEFKTDKSGKVYKLKPIGWKEVRPFEWPGLSEQERVQLARNGRLTLNNLRIPESDPIWTHFQYKRPMTSARTSNSTSSTDVPRASTSHAPVEDKLRSSAAEPPKRGVSSRELKEKKKKPKGDPKAEIQMKDEGQRALKHLPTDSVSEGRRGTVSTSQETSSSRPQPPSRQIKSPPVRREVEKELLPSSTAYSKPSTSNIGKLKPQEVTRIRESDIHGSDSEKNRVTLKDRIPKELQEADPVDSKPKVTKKKPIEEGRSTRKLLDGDHSNPSSPLKRKARDDSEGSNPKNQKRRVVEEDSSTKSSKLKTRDDDEYTISKSRVSSKRKAENIDDDDFEPVRQKKAKSDRDSISSSREDRKSLAIKKAAVRVEKGESSSTSKIRKTSPPPSQSNSLPGGRETYRRTSSTFSGSSSKPTKLRRRSPVYTSTEDEKEDNSAQPSVKSLPSSTATTTIKAQNARNNSSQPLPSNYDVRDRYNSTYMEYLSAMQKVLAQKRELESLLKNGDFDSSGYISDPEGGVELLPPEELEILVANHKQLHSDLQAVQDTFGRG